MSSNYRYGGEPEQRVFGALPAGDYSFSVVEAREPYESKAGNIVLPLRLTILPDGLTLFSNPWCGTDRNGEKRDGIAEFLLCINRAPKVGQEPDWKRLTGAKGKCTLRVKIAEQGALAGKEVNEIHYFHRPKQVGPTAEQKPQTYSKEEFSKAAKQQAASSAGPAGPDLAVEPDDIPFNCDKG